MTDTLFKLDNCRQKPIFNQWLIQALDQEKYHGLRWHNREEYKFQIPWPRFHQKDNGNADVCTFGQVFKDWSKLKDGDTQTTLTRCKDRIRAILNKPGEYIKHEDVTSLGMRCQLYTILRPHHKAHHETSYCIPATPTTVPHDTIQIILEESGNNEEGILNNENALSMISVSDSLEKVCNDILTGGDPMFPQYVTQDFAAGQVLLENERALEEPGTPQTGEEYVNFYSPGDVQMDSIVETTPAPSNNSIINKILNDHIAPSSDDITIEFNCCGTIVMSVPVNLCNNNVCHIHHGVTSADLNIQSHNSSRYVSMPDRAQLVEIIKTKFPQDSDQKIQNLDIILERLDLGLLISFEDCILWLERRCQCYVFCMPVGNVSGVVERLPRMKKVCCIDVAKLLMTDMVINPAEMPKIQISFGQQWNNQTSSYKIRQFEENILTLTIKLKCLEQHLGAASVVNHDSTVYASNERSIDEAINQFKNQLNI